MTKSKIIILIIAISVFITVTLWGFYQTRVVIIIDQYNGRKTTINMSRWEAGFLESFFRHSICCDQWGYTLFGCKPLAFSGKSRFFSSLASILPPEYCMRKGWKVLQKLHLSHPNFAIWSEKASWSKNVDCIYIAHRKSISEVLRLYNQDFCELAHHDYIDADELFQNIPKHSLMRDKLNQNETLLGILLGYGRDNSYLFCNKMVNHKDLNIWDQEIEQPIIKRCFKKLITFRDPEISDMLFPQFIGNKNSEETSTLKHRYLEVRQKIIDYYYGKSFLETTLSLLINGPPDGDQHSK